MTTPIFLNPVLQEKIWGGTKLQSLFHFPIPSDKTGEAWIISAHPHGVSTVKSPSPYAGMGLDKLYKQHPELFNGQHLKSFPLLIKLLDAADDLSVQVHPDDAYALSHEGEYGKNECWYVVQAEPGAKIVYGHSAMTKEEFTAKINEEAWNELFTEVPVKAGSVVVSLFLKRNKTRIRLTAFMITIAKITQEIFDLCIFSKRLMSQRFRTVSQL